MSDGPWSDLGPTSEDLPDDLRARIKTELVPGERLLWAAKGEPTRQPDGPGPLIGGAVAAIFLTFGFVNLGVGFNIPARPGGQADVPTVAGTVLAIIGSLFALGTVIGWSSRRSERKKVARTLYVLTDQRAIFWKPVTGTAAVEVHTIARGTVKKIHRLELPDGSGDVIFAADGEKSWDPPRLEGVREVRRVEDLIRRNLLRTESHVA